MGRFVPYLDLTEEHLIPDAVTANDLCTFSFGRKVEQPALYWGVSLAKYLGRKKDGTKQAKENNEYPPKLFSQVPKFPI